MQINDLRNSTQKPVRLMPLKSLSFWSLFGMAWHQNALTVQGVIVTPIFKILFQTPPNLKPSFIADSDITQVE